MCPSMKCAPYSLLAQRWEPDLWRFAYDSPRQEFCERLSRALDPEEEQPVVIYLIGPCGVGKSSLFNRAKQMSKSESTVIELHKRNKYFSLKDSSFARLIVQSFPGSSATSGAIKRRADMDYETSLRHLLRGRKRGEYILRMGISPDDPSTEPPEVLSYFVFSFSQSICIEMHNPMDLSLEPDIQPELSSTTEWGWPDKKGAVAVMKEKTYTPITVELLPFEDLGIQNLCYVANPESIPGCPECSRSMEKCNNILQKERDSFEEPNFVGLASDVPPVLKQWGGTHPLLLHLLCHGLHQKYKKYRRDGKAPSIDDHIINGIRREYCGTFDSYLTKIWSRLPENVQTDADNYIQNDEHSTPLDSLEYFGLVYEDSGTLHPIKLLEKWRRRT